MKIDKSFANEQEEEVIQINKIRDGRGDSTKSTGNSEKQVTFYNSAFQQPGNPKRKEWMSKYAWPTEVKPMKQVI